METRWLTTALAALAVTAAPLAVRADEAAGSTPAPEPTQAAPVVTVAAPAPATTSSTAAPVVMAQSQTPPATPAPAAPAPTPPPPPKFTYGGSADFYWANNFNDPFNHKNQLRAFDIEDDGSHPHLGLIDLWAQYARDPVGGRLDIDFGPTARLVNAFEPSRSDLWEHIQQAYISVNLDGKKGKTYIDAGKWVTTAGAEVIEPKDNWLYSRGLLFTWAIPFYHLGVRGYHYFNDTDYVMAAIDRGWNAVGDPNHDPGFMLAGAKALNKQWTVTGNYIGGEETLTSGSPGTSWRNLVDVILAYNPNAKWSHSFNIDYGQQSSSLWYGISAMSKYTLDKKSYVAGRAEWLRDDKGALFGTSADAYSLSADYVRFINKYLQLRAEIREDFNGGTPLFVGDAPGKTKKNQGSILISAIVSYN